MWPRVRPNSQETQDARMEPTREVKITIFGQNDDDDEDNYGDEYDDDDGGRS